MERCKKNFKHHEMRGRDRARVHSHFKHGPTIAERLYGSGSLRNSHKRTSPRRRYRERDSPDFHRNRDRDRHHRSRSPIERHNSSKRNRSRSQEIFFEDREGNFSAVSPGPSYNLDKYSPDQAFSSQQENFENGDLQYSSSRDVQRRDYEHSSENSHHGSAPHENYDDDASYFDHGRSPVRNRSNEPNFEVRDKQSSKRKVSESRTFPRDKDRSPARTRIFEHNSEDRDKLFTKHDNSKGKTFPREKEESPKKSGLYEEELNNGEKNDSSELETFAGDGSMPVQQWLESINAYALQNNWDTKMKIFQMTTKLTGYARSWYIGLDNTNYSWAMWKEKLLQAFPCEEDFHEQLTQMLKRKKLVNETYDKYFCNKMAMINACDISGRRAVSCIIGGITNKAINKEAKQMNFDKPEKLYEYLRNRKDPHIPPTQKEQVRVCFNCKKPGHNIAKCPYIQLEANTVGTPAPSSAPGVVLPKGKENVICFQCGQKGHYVSKCPGGTSITKPNQSLTISKIPVMQGNMHLPSYTKFFVDCLINGKSISGYIDLESKHVTIKQGEAIKMNLRVTNVNISIEGFGNSIIPAIGVTDFFLKLSEVSGNVLGYVIPDEVQAIGVIVGTSFTNSPNFTVDFSGESIKILLKDGSIGAGQQFGTFAKHSATNLGNAVLNFYVNFAFFVWKAPDKDGCVELQMGKPFDLMFSVLVNINRN